MTKALLTFVLVLCIPAVVLATNVSGVIAANTTWTKNASPYIVTDNIAVDSGVTLTIEPGVTVLVDKYCLFLVYGKLIAVGTPTDSIFFDCTETGPTNQGWDGISIGPKNDKDTSLIQYCRFQHAYKALTFSGSSPRVSNCLFFENYHAIRFSWNHGYPKITNCGIIHNFRGIQGGTIDGGEITGNEILFNDYGITNASNPTAWRISNNNVSYNNFGIYYNYGSGGPAPEITGNTVIGNVTYGITVGNCCGLSLPIPLSDNIIMYNGNGLVLAGISNGLVAHNTIAYNDVGVLHHWSSAPYNLKIENNCITNSTNYNFKTQGPPINVGVANNWWGTTNTSIIDSLVFDFYDNITLGKVQYTPYLSQPVSSCQPVAPPPSCQHITNVVISRPTPTTVVASWPAVPGAVGYEYFMYASPTPQPSWGYFTTDTSVTYTGQIPNVAYDFWVRARCVANPYHSPWVNGAVVPVSVEEIEATEGQLKVYPNPSAGIFKVELPAHISVADAVVTDMLGKVVAQKSVSPYDAQFDLQNMSKGLYTIQLTGQSEVYRAKLIIR